MARLIPFATLAFAALTLVGGTAPAASAEMWCIRDFGSSQRTCVFPSAQDCIRAATVAGGRCERDTAVETRRDSKPERRVKHRSAD